MIILTETTDTIQVVLGGSITTNQLRCFSSYRDITTTTYVPGRNAINTNNTTDVNIVTSPAVSTQRVVDFISIYNFDTVNQTVIVKLDANGTETILTSVSLGTGERLEYVEGYGFRVIGNNGAIKQTYSSGTNPSSSLINISILGADVTNNNGTANTIQDVTGLSFPVTSGLRYKFKFVIWYTAAATTTGSRWTINGPTTSSLSYRSNYGLTTTSETINNGLGTYDLPAASNASSPATAQNLAIVEGFVTPTANGTVIARFASEVLSSAIVAKAGSYVEYQQI